MHCYMNVSPSVSIWSAVPTPLTADLRVDEGSVERMIEAAVREGTEGLFVAGTCGEERGPVVLTGIIVHHGPKSSAGFNGRIGRQEGRDGLGDW